MFANSFALTSRLSHLLSPAAPAGHGAHPARAGAHLARRRGCYMLSPHCGQHLRPQLSFVLTGKEKQEEVGSWAGWSSAGQCSLRTHACLHPVNLALCCPRHRPYRSCPSALHALGRRMWELEGISPRASPPWLGKALWTPLPWGACPGSAGVPVCPTGCAGPSGGAPPPACLCSGLSLTFSPSSALWIYFYLYRALLICPCYHLSPSTAPCPCPRAAGDVGPCLGTGNGVQAASPRPFSPMGRPSDSLPLLEGRRRFSSITLQILLAGCLLPPSPARHDRGDLGGPSG